MKNKTSWSRPWRKSKLQAVWICPWKAYAEYELGLPVPPTAPAVTGIGGHAMIGYNLASIIGKKDPDKYVRDCDVEITDEADELATLAIENFPINTQTTQRIEAELIIDNKGQPSKSPQYDWFKGTLDVIAVIDDTLCILDHKTGRMWTDAVYERHGYVLLAKAHFPNFNEITFGRYWVRTGECDWYHYRWERKGRGKQKLFIDDVEHDSRFLFKYIKEKIEHAESLEPVPTPGEHCENMFGEACPFLGNECPLNQDGKIVPVASDIDFPIDNPTKYLMEAEPERRVAMAFRMLLQGLPADQITPEIADLAKQGIAHVRNGATKVNARLKELSKTMCFQSAGKWHGMKPKRKVDVELALATMFGRDIPLKEMAKACSISATGINNMGVDYDDTKQFLLDECVDNAGGEEFGPIKKVE